jgi:hypothetical protein
MDEVEIGRSPAYYLGLGGVTDVLDWTWGWLAGRRRSDDIARLYFVLASALAA